MLFSSISFIYFFLPLVLLGYFILPKKLKNCWLFVASVVFYFVGVQWKILSMFVCILVNYILALAIDRFKDKPRLKGLFLILALIASFSLLVYYKYTDFFISNINSLFGVEIPLLSIALPIGISFYVFQTASYTIDVYKGVVRVQKNPLTLAAYITMFPQLVAGPIVRYKDVENELYERKTTLDGLSYGVKRFVIGLSKKVLIADTLAELCNDIKALDEKTVILYWLWAIAFTLEIYFDFSGYSDMAIGLGKLFGFTFPENFNFPYISKSISEFFRRWHISLGVWFRDYVYIPLGGSKRGRFRLFVSVTVVWLLTGLWHGAAWNFVAWGLFYALLILAEKLFWGRLLSKLPSVISHIYTMLAIVLGFAVFDADSLSEGFSKLCGMFGVGKLSFSSEMSVYILKSYAVFLIIAVFFSIPITKKLLKLIEGKSLGKKLLAVAEPLVLSLLLLTSTAFLIDGSFNPFIYFRF